MDNKSLVYFIAVAYKKLMLMRNIII